MTETITAAEREAVRRYQCDVFHCTTCDWLNGYEALIVDLERRLKIAEEALECFAASDIVWDGLHRARAQTALADMTKENK
jgi:hypothetical protein